MNSDGGRDIDAGNNIAAAVKVPPLALDRLEVKNRWLNNSNNADMDDDDDEAGDFLTALTSPISASYRQVRFIGSGNSNNGVVSLYSPTIADKNAAEDGGDGNNAKAAALNDLKTVSCRSRLYSARGSIASIERSPNLLYYQHKRSVVRQFNNGNNTDGGGTRKKLSHNVAVERPTLIELHKPVAQIPAETFANRRPTLAHSTKLPSSTAKVKFGWIEGVLIRCVLNILGVMLYLRLSWVGGQAGIGLGVVIILLGSAVTTVTALSMSAISTNGEIKGGGAYYMISRSLGPEFGGSIGIIFTIANNVGAAMYIVGFSETVRDLMQNNKVKIIDNSVMDVRLLSWTTAFILLCIVMIGVSFESKAQLVLLITLLISVGNYVIGTFLLPRDDSQKARGITGYSFGTFATNFYPEWFKGESFFSAFAVYFPAATGIMAGANISGDLKDPQTAIPKGTLLAILLTTLLYVGGLVLTGSTCVRHASGDIGDFLNNTLDQCKASDTCKFGLLHYYQIMEMESLWGPLITAGIFAATLSSALASLVSAPKILQAVAKDRIFPKYLNWFGRPFGKSQEPRRAYFLCFFICLLIIAIGDLNAIAPIISNFFLASYTLVNFACFHASYSESLGFRPSFKYYNKWVSLLGALICIVVMFVISWATALITYGFVAVLYIYLWRRKPDVNWGSSTQAHMYTSALRNLQKLQLTEDHVKNYRPQILLLSGTPTSRPALVDFAANITKDNSLLACADIIVEQISQSLISSMKNVARQVTYWFRRRKVRAFYYPIVAPSLNDGLCSLLQSCGLSKVKPNIVMMGFKHDWTTADVSQVIDYFGVIHCIFNFQVGFAILRGVEGLDVGVLAEINDMEQVIMNEMANKDNISEVTSLMRPEDSFKDDETTTGVESSGQTLITRSDFRTRIKKGIIDVWWLYDDGGLTLLVPHLLSMQKSYLENAQLRIFNVVKASKVENQRTNMETLLKKFRIVYENLTILAEKEEREITFATRIMFENLIHNFLYKDEEEENSEEKAQSQAKTDDENKQAQTKTEEKEEEEEVEEPSKEIPLEIPDPGFDVYPTEAELGYQHNKINKHLGIRELVLEHSSKDASLIIMTMPVPRMGSVSAYMYMSWLDVLSRDMGKPVLLVRGNQESVLTFYS